MNKILFITYFFPPLGMGGVQRQAKLCKYLIQLGWDISVLTSSPKWFIAYDDSIYREIKNQVKIFRIPSYDHFHINIDKISLERDKRLNFTTLGSSDIFSIPDKEIGWYFNAVKYGRKIIKDRSFDFILVSVPPFSSALIARRLSKISGVPYLIDFRDPWIDEKLFPSFSYMHRKLNYFLEKRTILGAFKILTINEKIKKSIENRYKEVNVEIINQGYDPDDYQKDIKDTKKDKLSICYMGSLLKGRKPDSLIKALNYLLDENEELKGKIFLHFVGKNSQTACLLAQKMKIKESVVCYNYIEHRKALKIAQNADLLWLYISQREGENISTGKLYEYIGTGNVIIASIPGNTAAAETLREFKRHYIVEPENYVSLSYLIKEMYYKKLSGESLREEIAPDGPYNRKNIAQKLSSLLRERNK